MIQEAETASEVMDRIFVECSALGFQSVVTSILAIACYVLWRRQRGEYFLTWAIAWAVYVIRLACMSAFLVRRDLIWLFLHQAATGISALLLLAAALQMSRGFVLRPIHALLCRSLAVAWAWITIYGMGSMLVAGVTATVLLSGVTHLDRRRLLARAGGSRAAPRRCWPARSSCGGCITSTTRCCAASARPCSTASSPMCCSCSPSAWDCCSWCSATNATGWRRGPPSSSS